MTARSGKGGEGKDVEEEEEEEDEETEGRLPLPPFKPAREGRARRASGARWRAPARAQAGPTWRAPLPLCAPRGRRSAQLALTEVPRRATSRGSWPQRWGLAGRLGPLNILAAKRQLRGRMF